MLGVEVSSGEFCRRLNDTQRSEVRQHLESGRGVAAYEDERGRVALLVSWGDRSADLPGLPPSHYGRGALHSYVPAPVKSRPMRSPLLDAVGGPPQIKAPPRVAPSSTEYPEVFINSRTSSHPRGNANGYIEARPQLPGPGREQAPPPQPPQEPSTPDSQWWQDALRGR